MRFGILLLLWIIGVGLCTAQDVLPPQFSPYTGPTIAFPETHVGFSLLARSFQTNRLPSDFTYELLEAPTNTSLITFTERPDERFAWIEWQTPSRALIGSTNVFTIRATDQGLPPLSTTNTLRFVLVDLPPVRSFWISNGVPWLQFSNPIPAQALRVLWSADLSGTNWTALSGVASSSPLVTVSDTNGLMQQRFYRLVPHGGWFYGLGP